MRSAGRDTEAGLRSAALSMLGPRGAREVISVFGRKQLLVEAGAVAFRVLLALIPGALFVVGVLGLFGFEEVWSKDVAPDVKASVSPAAFKFFDEAIRKVLQSRDLFWVTFGAVLTLWEASAVVRAVGNVMNRIYEVDERRSFRRELLESLPTGAAAGALVLAALASIRLGPIASEGALGDGGVADIVSPAICWAVGAGFFFALVVVLIRFAPAIERPARWLSLGAALIVVASATMTLAFGLYLRYVASYESVFGSLATAFVVIEYLFLLAVAFLGGVVVDAILDGRERHA